MPGPGSRVAQLWMREGNVALDSYRRAFGNAQPDGRERRPGCSPKHCQRLCLGLGGAAHGHLAWKGALPRLTSFLTARHSKACHPEHKLGLLMSSVPSTTHWIIDSGQIKQVSQVMISMYGSEGTSKFQSHGATVPRSAILLVRP